MQKIGTKGIYIKNKCKYIAKVGEKMSIKINSNELIEIAQGIAEKKNLNIKELVESNKMNEVNEIWKEAVKEFDKKKNDEM